MTYEELVAQGATPGAPPEQAQAALAGAPAAPGGEFEIRSGPAEDPNAPGGLASFGRGVVQGGTFGFSDEIAGAIGSLFSDKSYAQVRDESRQADAAARTAHPLLYGAGELGAGVATSFVPGLNVAKGASALAAGAKLGIQGAAAGLGASESNTLQGMAGDAALGGIVGGVAGGALHGITSRVAESAPRRAVDETVADAMSAARPKDAKMISRQLNKADVEAEAEDLFLGKRAAGEADFKPVAKAIRQAQKANTPEAIQDALGKAKGYVNQLDEATAPAWGKLDSKLGDAGGLRPGAVLDDLDDAIQKSASSLGEGAETKVLRTVRDKLQQTWTTASGEDAAKAVAAAGETKLADRLAKETGALTPQRLREIAEEVTGASKLSSETRNAIESVPFAFNGDAVIPGQALRQALTKAQNSAVEALGTIAETEHARLRALPMDALKGSMDSFLENARAAGPEASKLVDDILTRNRRMSLALAFQEGLSQRLDKVQAGKFREAGGAVAGATRAGGVLTSLATGNPLPAIGGYALPVAAKEAKNLLKLGNNKLAMLVYQEAQGQLDEAGKAALKALRAMPEGASRLAAAVAGKEHDGDRPG